MKLNGILYYLYWLDWLFCLCLLFSYEEETPSTITMGFVSSLIPLLIASKKICSIWLWDNNPCNRNKGRLWDCHWHVKIMDFFSYFSFFFFPERVEQILKCARMSLLLICFHYRQFSDMIENFTHSVFQIF